MENPPAVLVGEGHPIHPPVAAGVGRAADVSVRPEEDLVTVPAEVPVLAHLVAGTKRRWVPLVLPRWVESKM